MQAIYPIILAGGSGTRLWPLSRKNFPKQFIALRDSSSLLQHTINRVNQLCYNPPLLVTNDAHYFLCQEQLNTITDQAITYILEPCARNTAPAIATAAYHLQKTVGNDAIMLILPADHHIADQLHWQTLIQQGCTYASNTDDIVTFGIIPKQPKTGYGYIEADQAVQPGIHILKQFHEKPTLTIAEQFITKGNFYWNSGIFSCRVSAYLQALNQYAPDIAQHSLCAYNAAYHHNDFIRLNTESFSACRNESIDYAIMEHVNNAVILPMDVGWSDLGCWASVAEANPCDTQGNVLQGNVIAQNSTNCLINSADTLITAIGVHNQIIVATHDAILVADKQYAQQVKELVAKFGEQHHNIAKEHTRVTRPWGFYEILAEGPTFKVKRLMIKPAAQLSLQMHQHRAEHWVIVDGIADIINNKQELRLSVNQSTYIPPKTLHRLSNTHTQALYVIEVQSGDYLGEDDIQRFDDIYQRAVITAV